MPQRKPSPTSHHYERAHASGNSTQHNGNNYHQAEYQSFGNVTNITSVTNSEVLIACFVIGLITITVVVPIRALFRGVARMLMSYFTVRITPVADDL